MFIKPIFEFIYSCNFHSNYEFSPVLIFILMGGEKCNKLNLNSRVLHIEIYIFTCNSRVSFVQTKGTYFFQKFSDVTW